MPVTVENLFKSVDIENDLQNQCKFRKNDIEKIVANNPGIYIITLQAPIHEPLFNEQEIQDYVKRKFKNQLNHKEISKRVAQQKEELQKFWHDDEIILYIGQTGSKLSSGIKNLLNINQVRKDLMWEENG